MGFKASTTAALPILRSNLKALMRLALVITAMDSRRLAQIWWESRQPVAPFWMI
jgi:hypothetical protein